MAQMGRPRTFDRDEAIRQAMTLFWQYGYESTSLAMLKSNLGNGITAPSFYAAFGSKEALFEEVVECYASTYGQVNDCLWDDTFEPREAVELALRRSAKMQTEPGHPSGCLIALSVNTCSPANDHIREILTVQRERTRAGFLRCVTRAKEAGQLAASTDVRALAVTLHSFELGLSTEARDGASGKELDAAVSAVMKVWDANISDAKN
ncbi:TetR/AcrR family transcriptional regulator [Pantoea sp. B550]|uniref:TetR/AcrR family transcriptional regulator n=1 Tax=Pantoea TaxID=53335 RepID=UPI000E89CE8A|nr:MULTISPECIES: TetR/AcrR family transcriptional regulator [Pantoea]HBV92723.1 TetR family transcriptional regulator [Pantoea sp.]MCP1204262.1 TetR/AcrR family transcriptional regulator [Pantoea sp. B550]MCT2417909.1 TetR/AcrR family transcriptional regulator [Pantoea sp. XY16]QZX97971.1 TetR/AcrR family transcriptional regulator [Pantoea alfalfae]WIL44051.1 TetR/AcrR family transcriptional regulator [Pantoea agglomerans]